MYAKRESPPEPRGSSEGPWGGVYRNPAFSPQEFRLMKTLAQRPICDLDLLMATVGKGRDGLEHELDSLQRECLVDCTTFLDGERVKTVLSLTPEGRETFLRVISTLYEIPE